MDRGLTGPNRAVQERLSAARTLARDGRHEEALQEHLWFHEHALETAPAFSAVRLSYAISYWAELGQAYPKAKAALEAVRDRAADSVLAGDGGRKAFHEVAAINDELGCADRTYALFKDLAISNEQLAKQCAQLALPSILHARDYALAERFMRDPVQEVRSESDFLNRTFRLRRQTRFSPAPRIKVEIGIYAERVKALLQVLEGRGRLAEARELRALAVQSIQATTIREAVEAALKPGARPWYERARPRARRHR